MTYSFADTLVKIWEMSGFATITWQQLVMILVSFVLIYLAIVKKFEPLLLLPIAFGMLLANMPMTGLMDGPLGDQPGGLLYYLYQGIELGIYPPLIFLGIGAMTDLLPLLPDLQSVPRMLLLNSVFISHFYGNCLRVLLKRHLELWRC